MTKKTGNIVSFVDAYQFLKKFRYKPRKEGLKMRDRFLRFATL